MKSFVATIVFSLCIFHMGNSAEFSNKALETVQGLKSKVQSELEMVKLYTQYYGVEINEHLDLAQNQYQERFNKEINSTLEEIKDAIAKTRGRPPKECYAEAKSRFDKLNVTSNVAVEQCILHKEDGIDAGKVLESLVSLLTSGEKLLELVEKVEKDIEKSGDSELKSVEEKQIPAAVASFSFYDFAMNSVKKRAIKAIDETVEHAKKCNDKELADVHVIALIVRENAFKCIQHAY